MFKNVCEKPSFPPKMHPFMETTMLHNRDTAYKVGYVFVFTEIKGIRNLKNVLKSVHTESCLSISKTRNEKQRSYGSFKNFNVKL